MGTSIELDGTLRRPWLIAVWQGMGQVAISHVGGLNGILLGAAAESGLRGACLLGEMPQLPNPKASLAVLKAFTRLAEIEIDFAKLTEQAKAMDEKLGDLSTAWN